MHKFLLFIALALSSVAAAQADARDYLDVVKLRSGRHAKGKVLEYVYGEKVILLATDGELETFEWGRIRKVSYEVGRGRSGGAKAARAVPVDTQVVVPTRAWFHDVAVGGFFGVEASPFQFDNGRSVRVLGYGISYLHVRNFKGLRYGGGLDYVLYNFTRGESSLAVVGMVELPWHLTDSPRLVPFIRLTGGPSIPIGTPSSGNEITRRSVSFLAQPTVGVEFRTQRNEFDNIFFDVGYRFLDSRFTVVTNTLDVVERNINYRRFTLRGGFKF